MKNRMNLLLYNAISLLVDETIEEFDDTDDWFEWICDELDCTEEELKEFGIDREKLHI